MSQTGRELKQRMGGIRQIRKITKAMELVAAAKMRRSLAAALASRAYALRAWELLTNLADVADPNLHPLLSENEAHRGLIIVFTPDRGLAGGMNARLVELTLEEVKSFGEMPFDVITVGKKGEEAFQRIGFSLLATFHNPKTQPAFADILPIARLAIDGYREGRYHRVVVIWTDYHSSLVQRTESRLLLPITREELKEIIEESGDRAHHQPLPDHVPVSEYLFEPSPDAVLEAMLTRLTEMQLYQVFLEATASEHAARMMTMRNASDAAADLIDELTFEFNQARQAGITQDLTELSAARLALE